MEHKKTKTAYTFLVYAEFFLMTNEINYSGYKISKNSIENQQKLRPIDSNKKTIINQWQPKYASKAIAADNIATAIPATAKKDFLRSILIFLFSSSLAESSLIMISFISL